MNEDWRRTLPAERHARWVLHYYGLEGGWEPGSCSWGLIRALMSADTRHFAAIGSAFPALTSAVAIGTERHGAVIPSAQLGDGVKMLALIASGQPVEVHDLWRGGTVQAEEDDL